MKRLVFCVLLIVALVLSGCASTPLPPQQPQQPQPPQTTPSVNNQTASPLEEDSTPSIGGISLGDSTGKVDKSLGLDFQLVSIEDGGYFGESYQERTYPNGIKIILGKSSGKVLQIMSTDANLTTDLGIKIGDVSEEILQTYRVKYKEPVSQHGSDKLNGWFEVGNGQLMIFDFTANDESMVNQVIKPESKVERIVLTYSHFMD